MHAETAQRTPATARRPDWLVGGAAVAAASGAVFAWAACCALPMALALGGVGFSAAAIAGQRSWITLLAAVVLAAGWGLTWRRARACRLDRGCAPPSRVSILLLSVATALLLTAMAWPRLIEPSVLSAIRAAGV